jgi:hypothetical protein
VHIKWLLRGYRATLLVTLALSYGVAVVVLLALLAAFPHVVLYMLDVLSPITNVVKDLLWSFFPEARWVRDAGQWMGSGLRWALSLRGARTEAIARIGLLDGPILLSFLAWGSGTVLRVWANIRIARWFNERFEIVPKSRSAAEPQSHKRLPPAPQLQVERSKDPSRRDE